MLCNACIRVKFAAFFTQSFRIDTPGFEGTNPLIFKQREVMATQHSKKSKKATPGKAKPSKAAVTKKPVKKAVAKAKPAVKSKPAAKPVKGKKVTAVKSKPVAKAKMPVKAAKPKSKPVLASKAKPAAKQPVKAKPVAPVKAGKAPTRVTVAKSSKTSVKVTAPTKSPDPVKGSQAPKKLATVTGSAKSTIKQVEKAHPPVINKPQAISVRPPVATAVAKPIMGSKATDMTKKPTVSTGAEAGAHPKPNLVPKPKPTFIPQAKHIIESKPKPFEKMTEKKDFKPSTMVATAEEPQKSRYSDKELEEFDQLIDQKLIIAREQLEFYLKQLEDMAENPDNKIKGLDDGLSTLESERVSSLASRQQKLIQHLENAKIRIKNKVYGICRETGKLISKERLRAVPHATLSIEAKQAQN
jgi:RNA polymerase-binding transcription factor DksA